MSLPEMMIMVIFPPSVVTQAHVDLTQQIYYYIDPLLLSLPDLLRWRRLNCAAGLLFPRLGFTADSIFDSCEVFITVFLCVGDQSLHAGLVARFCPPLA